MSGQVLQAIKSLLLNLLLLVATSMAAPQQAASRSFYFIELNDQTDRTWSNCFGDFANRHLDNVCAGIISLSYEDVAPAKLPLAAFSQSDIDFIKELLAKSGKDSKLLGAAVTDEDAAQLRLDLKAWKAQLGSWSKEAQESPTSSPKAIRAWQCIRSVRDPEAMKALDALLSSAKAIDVRLACLEAIAATANDQSLEILVREAVNKDEEISSAAAFLLRERGASPKLIAEFAKWIKSGRSQAAILALQAVRQRDPLELATKEEMELVEALIAKLTIRYSEEIRFRIWTGFDTGWQQVGPQSLRRIARIGSRPSSAIVQREVPNPFALQLLTKLTGREYGYDRNEWRKWLKATGEAE